MGFGLFLIVFVVAALVAVYKWQNREKLPAGAKHLPGPTNLPFIGRVHDVPAEAAWLKFYEWSKEYGPIYRTDMFGSVHVWISSEKIAHDLLSKRAVIYSDRPQIPNLPDNRTSGDYLALLGRTETWKRQRKLCNHLMHTSALDNLHEYPTRERNRFLWLMSRDPANYVEWIEQFTSRTVSRLSWGTAHPAQVLRHTTFGLLETISPAGALPNVMSFLRHLPFALSPWQQKERRRHQLETKLFKANIGFVEKMVDTHEGGPSFFRTFMENKKHGVDEKERGKWGEANEAMNVVGLMAIAGALTIGSPIQSFILAMCHYPDWQRKLQDEIERALPDGRCPTWEDREKLPMLRAVVKEVIRWRPPVPTGIPHAVEKDDVYDGFFIPAGATIHALEWGITRDEEVYPDAETFNPDRWLNPSYKHTYREPLTQYPNLNGFSQFGFGRRTCQGIPIVDQDLFLTMGGMAWAFSIQKKRDPATGAEIPVHWNDYTPLLIAKPAAFQFEAVPRSEERLRQVRALYEDAKMRDAEEDAAISGTGIVDVKDSDGGAYFRLPEEAMDTPEVVGAKRATAEVESETETPSPVVVASSPYPTPSTPPPERDDEGYNSSSARGSGNCSPEPSLEFDEGSS